MSIIGHVRIVLSYHVLLLSVMCNGKIMHKGISELEVARRHSSVTNRRFGLG